MRTQLDSTQMKDNGSFAKIAPRTHGQIRAPFRGVESAVVSLSVPHSGLALLQGPQCYSEEKDLKDHSHKWHHSHLGKMVRRIGTVPAMSAWKAAAGPPEPCQGSRLRRDRRSRLPGLDRVSAGPAFWLPRAYGFFRARRSTEEKAK